MSKLTNHITHTLFRERIPYQLMFEVQTFFACLEFQPESDKFTLLEVNLLVLKKYID